MNLVNDTQGAGVTTMFPTWLVLLCLTCITDIVVEAKNSTMSARTDCLENILRASLSDIGDLKYQLRQRSDAVTDGVCMTVQPRWKPSETRWLSRDVKFQHHYRIGNSAGLRPAGNIVFVTRLSQVHGENAPLLW